MKTQQLLFKLSGVLPNGQEIKSQICTTHTVINIFVMGATVNSLERFWP